MNFQSARALQIKSSPSMVVSLAARKMRAAGDDVIDLSLGEPDFATPPHIIEAAYQAMKAGRTRYTGPDGSEELRAAVVAKFKRENGLDYAIDEIAVGNGAKQIIFNAFLATLEPGDEVIIPAPYWVSYTDIAVLHGGVARTVKCGVENGFKLTPERLEAAITDRTRWLLLNSPSNPSGAVYSRDEYAALGEVISRHPNVLVLADEIYEHIVAGAQPFVSFATACPATASAHAAGERRVEGIRHDRLAAGLCGRAEIAHRRPQQDAVAKHDLSFFDLAGCRRGRAEWPASLRH